MTNEEFWTAEEIVQNFLGKHEVLIWPSCFRHPASVQEALDRQVAVWRFLKTKNANALKAWVQTPEENIYALALELFVNRQETVRKSRG